MNKEMISGRTAATPETKSSSPSKSLSKSAPQPELPLAHGNGAQQQATRASSEHQMVFENISQPLNIGTDEPYVTKAHVSRRFKMSYRTIERNVADGMPSHPIGKRGVRFIVSEVQRWLDKNARRRFAATGRRITKEELQRRIVVIPLLEGLQIVETAKPPPTAAGKQAKAPVAAKNRDQSAMPRCKPGRKKRKPERSPENPCPADKHKWSKGRYSRTCVVCGVMQERGPHDEWTNAC